MNSKRKIDGSIVNLRKSPRLAAAEVNYNSNVQRKLSFLTSIAAFPAIPVDIIYDKCNEYLGKYALYIVRDPVKGFSVYSSEFIPVHSMVAEYAGELLSQQEADKRSQQYSKESTQKFDTCYMFYFTMASKVYCIDATVNNKSITTENANNNSNDSDNGSRHQGNGSNKNSIDMKWGYSPYFNHSRYENNLIPIKKRNNGDYKIVFYSKCDIPAHTELLFDYGERDPQALNDFPWLQQ
jgi:SET domain-containing protein